MSDDRPPLQAPESPQEPLSLPEPVYRRQCDAATLLRAAERFGERWTKATELLKVGLSVKRVSLEARIHNRAILAALRDSLGITNASPHMKAHHEKLSLAKARAALQDHGAHEQSIQRLALQSATTEQDSRELSSDGSAHPQRVKIDTKSEILQYRNMLRTKIPLKKRAQAWSELVSQDKNLIAKLRALELTDELCGYSAPKGAVNEAPLFQLEISQQVSVQPPEPKA